MGLDVYIYELAQAEANDRHDQEWEALYARKTSGEITQAEYDELSKKLTPYSMAQDVPSEHYPEHLFNRRYLRSSYNEGGFNRAVPDFLGEEKDLYWIFSPLEVDLNEGSHTLNGGSQEKLAECKQRALDVAAALRAARPLRVTSIEARAITTAEHGWPTPATQDEALAWYRGEAERATTGSWSNAKGDYFGTPLRVLAAVPGEHFRGPCVHLIYETSAEALESYAQSAEITAEFCDEAIALVERDGACLMSWSG